MFCLVSVFNNQVATQRADVTLFLPALKKKLRATSSGLPSRPCVRSTRLLALYIRVCGCAGLGSGLQSPSCRFWFECKPFICFILKPLLFNHLFPNLLVVSNSWFSVSFKSAQG